MKKSTLKKKRALGIHSDMKNVEFVTDQKGHQKVVLDFEEYLRLKQAAGQKLQNQKKRFDFHSLHGLALKAPLNPNPRFKTEDDLWEGMP